MPKTVELKAERREQKGKGYAKRARKDKKIPAVLYGGEVSEPILIEVGLRDFEKAISTAAGENVILSLKIAGDKKAHTVIIKDIQNDPVTDKIYHVDFNSISLTKKIKVKVPLHEKGECPGVKEGGVVDMVLHELEVECLPTDIPEKIYVDISKLNIGDTVLVKDLVLPSGVVSILEPDHIVFTVLMPKEEEEVAAVPEEGTAEPEVIRKGKEEAEEEAEEAPEKAAPPKEKKPPAAEEKK